MDAKLRDDNLLRQIINAQKKQNALRKQGLSGHANRLQKFRNQQAKIISTRPPNIQNDIRRFTEQVKRKSPQHNGGKRHKKHTRRHKKQKHTRRHKKQKRTRRHRKH